MNQAWSHCLVGVFLGLALSNLMQGEWFAAAAGFIVALAAAFFITNPASWGL